MSVWIKVLALSGVIALTGAGLAMYVLARNGTAERGSPNLFGQPRHPVTEPMWQKARAVAGKPAPDFTLNDPDGKPVTLHDELAKGPVVLVFTKDGCPCSIEAQPLFNQLATGYGSKAVFFGVIDGPTYVASKYRDDMAVPYRMLLGADGAVFKAYQAKQSAYTTLIGRDGVVVKQWPGYNKTMANELNAALAKATGAPPVKLDVSMVPETMNSGCAFQ